MTTETTSTHPQVTARVSGNTTVLTFPDGHEERISFSLGEDVRKELVMRVLANAQLTGEPMELVTSGELGEVHLAVHPDGRAAPAGAPGAWDAATPIVTPATEDDPISEEIDGTVVDEPLAPDRDAVETTLAPRRRERVSAPTPSGGTPVQHVTPLTQIPPEAPQAAAEQPKLRRSRTSFIDTREPMQVRPATGWRKIASVLGLKVSASPEEIARETARRTVSTQWGQCRRIAVVNGKGGVGKTPSTAMLAAVFGREGGGGVLAWDNNPTRGSLGWRTEAAAHDATVQDVLEHADRLLDPTAPRALVADFVHHQTDDRYDVLRSNPELLAIRQQIATDEFDLLSRVVDRHYRLVVFDSGNDESAPRWLRMIDWSHQLVVPTPPSRESAESAMLLLQELSDRDEHSRLLAENAVVIVTNNEVAPAEATSEIVAGFEKAGVRVLRIPFDPALKSGPLRFGMLRPATQDAWLQVAAAATTSF